MITLPEVSVSLHSVGPYLLLSLKSIDRIRTVACQLPNSDLALEAVVIPLRHLKCREKAICSLANVMSEQVLGVVDIRKTQRNMYIICEKPGLSLYQYFQGQVDLQVLKQVLRDCLKGLAALHLHLIPHGNLSPATIYVDSVTLTAKLGGFAAISGEEKEQNIAYYQAPEVSCGQEPSQSSDIYSLGCIAAFLETGKAPFSPKHCSYRDKGLLSLVCQMTRDLPTSRPTANSLLTHPFLT